MAVKQSGAVPVSRNLQLFAIAGTALGMLLPVLSLLPLYAWNTSGYRGDYALSIIVMTLYPLLIFAVTYIYSPKYPTKLNRAFIALIKSLAIVSVVMFLSTLKNLYPLFFPDKYVSNESMTTWANSFTFEYTIIALALITTIVVSSLKYRHKR